MVDWSMIGKIAAAIDAVFSGICWLISTIVMLAVLKVIKLKLDFGDKDAIFFIAYQSSIFVSLKKPGQPEDMKTAQELAVVFIFLAWTCLLVSIVLLLLAAFEKISSKIGLIFGILYLVCCFVIFVINCIAFDKSVDVNEVFGGKLGLDAYSIIVILTRVVFMILIAPFVFELLKK